MIQPSAMEMQEMTVFILDPKNLRRAGIVELLRSWAASVKVSLVDLPAVATPFPADVSGCRMVIINLGDLSVGSFVSQRLIQGVRGHLPLVPLVLISDREDSSEVVAAVWAGVTGYIPNSTEPDIAIRALTFIMGGGSFFPPTALMDLRDGMRFAVDEDKPDPDVPGLPKGGRRPLNLLKPDSPGFSNCSPWQKVTLGGPAAAVPAPNKVKPDMAVSPHRMVRGEASENPALVDQRRGGGKRLSRRF
jgi:DNA-binding NarL/FixJ family response regulator